MLVLTRKENEQVLIGDSIVVTVVQVEHGRVRLGIKAPRGVTILRDELANSNPRIINIASDAPARIQIG